MTGVLLQVDPAVLGLALVVWTWVGMRAASLAHAATPRELQRRTGRLLAGVGLGVVAIVARAAVVIALAGSGWWFVQEKVLLALPVVAVPAIGVLAVSVPRLGAVRRAARTLNGIDAMAPSLRQQAAHPLLVWPMQLTAFGAAAAEIVFFVVSYPATAGSAFAVLTGVGVAGAVAWHRLARRHRRLGDTVVVPSRQARLLRGTGMLAGLVACGFAIPIAALVVAAPTPPAHADAGHGALDLGGGPAATHGHNAVSVADLRGAADGGTLREFVLVAQRATVTLASGESVPALTYNGTLPGPRIEVTEGDIIQVVLRNRDIVEGVTIHWHGYDVPNGEDGVPGVTQDPVGVGEEFVYRFRADQVGTYWYHSHQNSYRQVTQGLYGTLVVHPKAPGDRSGEDIVAAYHRLDGGPVMLMGSDVDTRQVVAPGTPVRLRLVNGANTGNLFTLRGVTASMVAMDGGEIAGPEPVRSPAVDLPAGGRADLAFVMPAGAVRLETGGPSLLLTPPNRPDAEVPESGSQLIDPLRYGSPAATPFGAASRFDRDFTLVLDEKLARHKGIPTFAYTVNGNAYPEVPTQLVREGDLVRFTIVGRGFEAHPIHPHGHHVLVLSRNGQAPRTPLWLDTFEVKPGEVWQVAMRADNPGVWMDHCHDLRHAAEGMVFHLAYDRVMSPFDLSRSR